MPDQGPTRHRLKRARLEAALEGRRLRDSLTRVKDIDADLLHKPALRNRRRSRRIRMSLSLDICMDSRGGLLSLVPERKYTLLYWRWVCR